MQSGLIPNIHFIDNVRLELKKTFDDEIESVSISFLLVPNHGLEETHFLYVIDLSTRMLIFVIESIVEWRNFNCPIRLRLKLIWVHPLRLANRNYL